MTKNNLTRTFWNENMPNVTIANETARQLGHHANFQETVEKLKLYVEYLQQQEIIEEFVTIDFNPDADYKKQRYQR